MKFSIKSIDYKKLAINHAEKVVAGLIGLLVVLIVFMPLFAGKFSGYDKTPEELIKKAAETHDQILTSQWPDAEIFKYQGTGDLSAKIALFTSPVSPDFYDWSIEVAPPLYRKKEPRKEPDWLTVEGLLIASARGFFEVPPKLDAKGLLPEGSDGKEINEDGDVVIPLAKEDDQSDIPPQFRRKGGSRNSGSGPGAAFNLDDISGTAAGGGGNAGALQNTLGSSGMMEMMQGMGGEFGGEGIGSGVSGAEGRGQRYALLTGVFNIRAQRERIAEALSLPEVALNSRSVRFELLGFEVARKEGTEPWPKVEDHQILDIDRSMQVLMDMAGFDFDPVGYGVTHQQITSPLPPRVVGEWGDEIAHPKISNYVLNTEEGKDLQEYLTEYLAEQEDKNQKLKAMVEKDTTYGFASVQRNMRGLADQEFDGGSGQAGMQNFQNSFGGGMMGAGMMGAGMMGGGMMGGGMMAGGGSPGNQQAPGVRNITQQQQIESAVKRITASGTLLLFRYFDFDVEPGKTYQYRVRLIFENPNFNVPVSELEDPESRLGEIRKTPWSKLTQPITVLKDTEFFLTKVSIPAGKKSEASSLLMYQWKPDIGTVISSILDSQLGQYIGGEKVTEVLKPTEQTFEPEKVEFTSDDLLVDSSQGVDVNSKDHADLNLPKRLTGKGRLRIMDEALVQDSSGRLVSIDPFSSNTDKQNARKRFNYQNQPWQFLKELSEEGELDGEDGLNIGGAGGGSAMMSSMMGGAGEAGGAKKSRGRKGKFRRKNRLKKNSN